MLARSLLMVSGWACLAGGAWAQALAPVPDPPATAVSQSEPAPPDSPEDPSAPAGGVAPRIAQVSTGSGQLPNQHGQLWREYDISPYTLRIDSTARPEQAVVDWILRETGYEAWHSEPLAILSANRRRLLVYHTPRMQRVVAELVDRFVSRGGESLAFGLRLVTVDHPNWRARVARLLQPVAVQTPGVQAWLLEKEDAAILLAELQRRSDYREHSSPHLMVHNGQSAVISATRARHYIRSIVQRPEVWPGFEPQTAVIDEGFSLEFSPLLSVDGTTIDAAIQCNIDQVEKMVPVTLDVPTVVAPRQRTQIEVPQVAQFRFQERFRWPVDQALLVGLGMVALPVPSEGKPLVPGIPLPLPKTAPRADVLILVQAQAKPASGPGLARGRRTPRTARRGAGPPDTSGLWRPSSPPPD